MGKVSDRFILFCKKEGWYRPTEKQKKLMVSILDRGEKPRFDCANGTGTGIFNQLIREFCLDNGIKVTKPPKRKVGVLKIIIEVRGAVLRITQKSKGVRLEILDLTPHGKLIKKHVFNSKHTVS